MEIKNLNNPDDSVTIDKFRTECHVILEIGKGEASRHALLSAAEAKAVAYALLSYAQQI